MNEIWENMGLCPTCCDKVRAHFARLVGFEGPAQEIIDKGLDRFRQDLLGQFPMRASNVLKHWSLYRILHTTQHEYLHSVRGFGLHSAHAVFEVLSRNGLKPGMSREQLAALEIPVGR